jgi:periplasmic protein TonB
VLLESLAPIFFLATVAEPACAELTRLPATSTQRVAPLPPQPIRHRLEGEVVVSVTVGPDGRATDISVLKSSGHEALDQSAVDALKQSEFPLHSPGGVPRCYRAPVPMRYERSEGDAT